MLAQSCRLILLASLVLSLSGCGNGAVGETDGSEANRDADGFVQDLDDTDDFDAGLDAGQEDARDGADVTDPGPDEDLDCAERVEENLWIEMSDYDPDQRPEARLKALVVRPANEACRLPTVLIKTPYGIPGAREMWFGADNDEHPLFRSRDYAYVIVDWRGRGESLEAAYEGAPSPGQDGARVVGWITSQEWSDGKVGMFGASALGGVQFQTALEQPEGLVCAVPTLREFGYFYPQYYPGGVGREEYFWLLAMTFPDFIAQLVVHPWRDWYWRGIESVEDPARIRIPMLLVGGFWDHNDLFRSLEILRTQGHEQARDRHRLLFGNWHHFATGTGVVGVNAVLTEEELLFHDGERIHQQESLEFFDHYLRAIENEVPGWPLYRFFQTGEDTWTDSDSFPPQGTVERSFYLQTGGSLTDSPPSAPDATVEIPYDPADPSPTAGGNTMWPRADPVDLFHGPCDQRPVLDGRQDAVLFQSAVLDQPLKVQGYPHVRLYVASDQTDTDFAVRIVDVYPDGTLMLVRDGIRRLRFAGSFETPVLVPAGEETLLNIQVGMPVAHTFRAGHRVGLIVSSSNWPLFTRNPNNGQYFCSRSCQEFTYDCMLACENSAVASNTLHMDADSPSALVLPQVP